MRISVKRLAYAVKRLEPPTRDGEVINVVVPSLIEIRPIGHAGSDFHNDEPVEQVQLIATKYRLDGRTWYEWELAI